MNAAVETVSSPLAAFRVADVSMPYSRFAPRACKLAKSPGFERGKIMPYRTFCLDESQGYLIILLAKHFGTST